MFGNGWPVNIISHLCAVFPSDFSMGCWSEVKRSACWTCLRRAATWCDAVRHRKTTSHSRSSNMPHHIWQILSFLIFSVTFYAAFSFSMLFNNDFIRVINLKLQRQLLPLFMCQSAIRSISHILWQVLLNINWRDVQRQDCCRQTRLGQVWSCFLNLFVF